MSDADFANVMTRAILYVRTQDTNNQTAGK